jgi:hypothetical protein
MLWTAIILYLAVAFYLLPTLITEIRSAEHATAIFLVNLVLEWTVLGWLGALIWAVTGKDRTNKNRPGAHDRQAYNG